MKKNIKLLSKSMVKMPDVFIDSKNLSRGAVLDMYYGERFGIVIITHGGTDLSKDDFRRINILTTGKE